MGGGPLLYLVIIIGYIIFLILAISKVSGWAMVILTFGLLDALVPVVQKYPGITYIILGAIHPEVKKSQGEKYRLSLERKVHDLGLENNVIFHNRCVTSMSFVNIL